MKKTLGDKKRNYQIPIRMFLLLFVVMLFTGCGLFGKKSHVKVPDRIASPDVTSEEKEEILSMSREDAMEAAAEYMKNMTVEEKVGQLFIVNLELLDDRKGDFYEWKKFTKKMKASVDKYHIGGVILFSRNLTGPKQTKKLITGLNENSEIAPFIAVDEEGGSVARIANTPRMKVTKFPTMEEIGKTQDASYAYDMGITIADYMRELGFNVDFAPVADVKTSELNKEIGDRSFGADPDTVADFAASFVSGMQSRGISATLKHFPGQGSSSGDTHIGSVDIDSSITGLRKNDFVPFKAGIDEGVDFIMVSHISVSRVTETSQPASMSELIMSTILRDELGYQGIIITDAMDMASITNEYLPGEAAVGAIKAGADIVLMPKDLEQAYKDVLLNVNDGTISQERLDESVLRILTVKFMRGLLTTTIEPIVD